MKLYAAKNIIILSLGTVVLTLSGLNWHLGIAAWIAPALLLYFIRNTKWSGFLLFILFMTISGGVSQTGNNIFHIFFFNIINGLSFGLVYSLAYVIDKLVYKKNSRFYQTLIFPAASVMIEYSASFVFGSWGTLPHTQYPNITLMQIASVVGMYSITFIVAWFGSAVNWIIENSASVYSIRKGAGIYGGILIMVILFGTIRLSNAPEASESVKVATIVGSADLHQVAEQEQDSLAYLFKHPETRLPDRIFSTQEDLDEMIALTSEAITKGTKIIVWNEDALLVRSEQKDHILSSVKELCQEHEVYVLTAFLEDNTSTNPLPFNNLAILITPEGESAWEYYKANLHPYAETPIINPGIEKIPFSDTEYGRIGAVICADMDHNNYIANGGKQALSILMVPSFDWEGITPLHSEMACIEAIQNGMSIIRANGKGLSIVFDPYGRKLAGLNTFTSTDRIMMADLPIISLSTLYSKIGNSFALCCILLLLILSALRLAKKE